MEDTLLKIRHSLAHVLAGAVLEHDKDAKFGTGPATDNGFYYDIELTNQISTEDLPKLEKAMRKILKKRFTPELKTLSYEDAKEAFKDQPYKLELIEKINEEGSDITTYTIGTFTDLCEGPHVESSKNIDPEAFTLSNVGGAYWQADEKNQMLTRIYGIAFETKEELEQYEHQQEEARKRDHRKLGKELDLFVFSDLVGKGLPLYTERGATIRRELERFIVDEEIRRGYRHVSTPDIAKLDLYRTSGHYPHYKESMYAPITIDDEEFMLRPMTCPHHFELYGSKPRSYRELPMRIAEMAKLYRYEQSGELTGLIRVRSFCLADAHIICANEEQAVEEISGALDLIEHVADVFGLSQGGDYSYRLSLGNREDTEKYYDNPEAWDKGEALLREMLEKRGAPFVEAADEAAFYGPKIDVQMRNVNGKEDTAFTVQYDFCMPDRFDLKYIDSDGKEKRALVVHRSSIGALERIMAFLIEHFGGNFPLWLAPTQVGLVPVAESHHEYTNEVKEKLEIQGFRVEVARDSDSLGKRIHSFKSQKVPYIIVIGDKEIESQSVSPEHRDNGKLEALPLDTFIENIKKEREERHLNP